METNFNFKSQICTDKVQSERLIALGLKKETADMCYSFDSVITQPFIPSDIFRCIVDTDLENKRTLPAWSLYRLLSMLPNDAPKIFWILDGASITINMKNDCNIFFPHKGDIYKGVIDCIKWLIKKGYFNKEYLV